MDDVTPGTEWDSLTPEEKTKTLFREKWKTRVRLVEVGASGMMSQLEQCDLEPGELIRLRTHLEEIVAVVKMKHDEVTA